MEEMNLLEERKHLVIKINQHKCLKDIEKLKAIDEHLFQIKKEYETREALYKKDTENFSIIQKYPIDLNNEIDKAFESINASNDKDNIHENFVNKKLEEEKEKKKKEKIKLNNELEDSLKRVRRNRLIFFVKCLTAIVWLYVVSKLIGDGLWMWEYISSYLNPPLQPLPPEPAPPIWADQFLTSDKLEKMEGVITGEKLGELVLNEDNRLILFKTKSFIEGLEREVGLSVEDKKLINDKIT